MKYFVIFVAILAMGCGGYLYLSSRSTYDGKISHAKKNIVLFDFDGVICDSFEAAMVAFNDLAPTFHYKALNLEEKQLYRQTPTKKFLSDHRISSWKLPFFLYKMKKKIRGRIPSLSPFHNLQETLDLIRNKGSVAGILTSNSLENVQAFLKAHDIKGFDFIVHGSSLFGKDKLIKEVQEKSQAQNIIYIGDEMRDIEACKSADIPIISVTFGYHAENLLKSLNPDYLASSYKEVQNILSEVL